jgi:hypothetical protein
MGDTIEVRSEIARNGSALTVAFVAFAGSNQPIRMQYVLPDLTEPGTLALGEAMLISTIALAMQRRAVLRVHGQVSRSLRHTIDMFQPACAAWWPQRYQPIPIEVDVVDDRPPCNARGVVGFSGGLDSVWTAGALAAAGQVEAGLLVSGYDIDPDGPGQQVQRQRVRRLLDRIGIETLVINTDVRQVLGQEVIEGCQGSYLAAAMTLLSDRFGRGFLASGAVEIGTAGLPEPVHDVTTPLLGSARFPLLVHGSPVSRLDKLTQLARDPALFHDVRVCAERGDDANCGRCAKCVLHALACASVTGAWPDWLPRDRVQPLLADLPLTPARWHYGREVLRYAVAHGRSNAWMCVMARRLETHARTTGMTGFDIPVMRGPRPLWWRVLRRGWRTLRRALPQSG